MEKTQSQFKTYCTCGSERTFLTDNIFDAYCAECKKPTLATEFKRIMFGFSFEAYSRYQEEPAFQKTALGAKMTKKFDEETSLIRAEWAEFSKAEAEEMLMEKLQHNYYEDCLN
jgi:hypothetical protein